MVALAVAVLVGAVTMRATGMGFSLVASPFLVLALGPVQGILVANVCGTTSALLNLSQVYRDVEWRRARWVTPAGIVGVIPGAIAVRYLPLPVLAVVVSLVVIIGLAFTMIGRKMTLPNSPAVAGAGGLLSGFMSVTAAVGGPGLVIYALATRWPHRRFAATAQVHFAVLGIASLALKAAMPSLSLLGWLVLAASLAVGLVAGNKLAKRIDGAKAMRGVIVIAAVGAALSLVRGLMAL